MFKPFVFFQNARKIINLRFKMEERRGRARQLPRVKEHPAYRVLVNGLVVIGLVAMSQYLASGQATRVEITTQAYPPVQTAPGRQEEAAALPVQSQAEAPAPQALPEVEAEAALAAGPDWTKSRKPIQGQVVAAFSFGYAEFFDDYRLHGGLDYMAPRGTPVTAVLAGTVKGIYDHEWYGKMITIDHGDGWESHYAPVQDIEVVPGQWVEAGTQLGRLAAPPPAERHQGTHLHFELHHHGEPLDPSLYIR